MEEVNDNRDLDYFEADDNLESAGGKILDHCGRKEKELHSMVDRKDTAGSNMEEEVVNSKMEEEEVVGSKMKEEVVDQIIKGSVIQKTVRICTIAPSFKFKDSII